MKLIFCTSNKIGAVIIRGVTWSKYSHVGIIDGDNVIEAVWPKVRVVPLDEVIRTHSKYIIVDMPCNDEQKAIEAAYSQVGKPYDLAGVIGLGFHHNWQDENKWWCSELVIWCLTQGDTKLFRDDVLSRITPQHLWMLNFN